MKKKHKAFIHALATVALIAFTSWLVFRATSQDITPELAVNIDAGKVAGAVLDRVVDALSDLIFPDR